MSALDGFYATWYKARETFGVGTPPDGSQHDGSSQLLRMKGMVESAAKHDGWQGTGADAYAAANKEHANVYGKLAELDKLMAAEVTNAANIVTTGRDQLDATKSWVESAVDVVPKSVSAEVREKYLVLIAREGIKYVNNTVSTANADMLKLGFRITEIKNQYDELQNQKLGPGEKKDAAGLTDKDGDGMPDENDVHKRAEQDVQAALSGNKEAAGHVEHVLDRIKPGEKLTEEQGAYLSQMQAQQQGMSLERLKEVESQLGEHGDILADSWQLMSNKDVDFPRTDTTVDALDDPDNRIRGGFDQLPNSIKEVLNSEHLANLPELQTLANMVEHGDAAYQHNTDLDRRLLSRAADVMDEPAWKQPAEEYNMPRDQRPTYLDPMISDVFSAVSDDHEAIHDALTSGPNHIDGIDTNKFMEGITHRTWADGGQAAGELFQWTQNTSGSESLIAGETAEAYGKYLGVHGGTLLDLPGHHSIGEINSQLVQAFSHGLAPYQEEMVGEANKNGFDPLDSLGSNMSNTRNLFAVLDSDDEAAKHFNRTAYENVVEYEKSFAAAAKVDPTVPGSNPHEGDLRKAGALLGLIDAGAHIESMNQNENIQQSAYDHAHDAWQTKKAAWDIVGENVAGAGRVHAAFEQGIVGAEPKPEDFPAGTTATPTTVDDSNRQLGNGSTQAAYTVAAELVNGPNNHISPEYFNGNTLKTPAEIRSEFGESGWETYSGQLNRYFATTHPSLGPAFYDFDKKYNAPITNLPTRDD